MKNHPFLWKYKLNIESIRATEATASFDIDVDTEPEAKKPRIENDDAAAHSSSEKVRFRSGGRNQISE